MRRELKKLAQECEALASERSEQRRKAEADGLTGIALHTGGKAYGLLIAARKIRALAKAK